MHLLDTESFENTFGKKAHRKKPNLAVTDVEVKKMFLITLSFLPNVWFDNCFAERYPAHNMFEVLKDKNHHMVEVIKF